MLVGEGGKTVSVFRVGLGLFLGVIAHRFSSRLLWILGTKTLFGLLGGPEFFGLSGRGTCRVERGWWVERGSWVVLGVWMLMELALEIVLRPVSGMPGGSWNIKWGFLPACFWEPISENWVEF